MQRYYSFKIERKLDLNENRHDGLAFPPCGSDEVILHSILLSKIPEGF